MDALYTYLLLGSAAGCALGGVVGWWLRKQGEAARQHDVEVYYREALKISETSRDRAREEADQLGERMRELREVHEQRESEMEELQTFLEGVKQAGTDTTDRIRTLESEVAPLRKKLKERDAAMNRLQKEWKKREAQLVVDKSGNGELERVQAELKAMTEAHAASSSEADRLRKRLLDLETRVAEMGRVADNGNGSHKVAVAGNGARKVAVSGNGAPTWLMPSANGDQDDLKSIHGLGPVLEAGLNKLGVYYFRQVARMTKKDVEWLAPRLNIHPGRILRGEWAQQAKECHRRKYKEKL
jgi:predicted flap endonuclease-1-like 5' DNA nuclease